MKSTLFRIGSALAFACGGFAAAAGPVNINTADAAKLASEGRNPPEDQFASADFRRHLARVLTRRALEEATAR